MPSPVLQNMHDAITRDTSVKNGAKTLIDGFAQRLADAKAQALVNGATEQELAPIQAEIDLMNQSSNELAASVAANTPGA